MLYLLDANVLIDANRDYYPFSRVPEFWEWLVRHGEAGSVKVPIEVWEEVSEGTDELAAWMKRETTKQALLLEEECSRANVTRVVDDGYASDLSDDEVEKLGRDPFLVAYGFVVPAERCVVTTEKSSPARQRANRRVPDVCARFGIGSCTTFDLIRRLDFRTRGT